MEQKTLMIGNTPARIDKKKVIGKIIYFNNEPFYKIENFDQISPFFMSIVSDSDLWMFLSSNGALTAGRRNPDNALFPYYTDDRIHDSAEITGSKTIIIVKKEQQHYLWEPFSQRYQGLYQTCRNIYKNMTGNKVVFEEENLDLGLSFFYEWNNCDEYGFIRKSTLVNHHGGKVKIDIIDGLQNLLPSGIDRKFQLEYSTLVDGYKKNELIKEVNLGLYRLSSIPADRAEPNEALTVTTVWSTGLDNCQILLCSDQLPFFRQRLPVHEETDIRARRGAFLVNSQFKLKKNEKKSWALIADLNKDHTDVAELTQKIRENRDLLSIIEKSVNQSTENLLHKISKADGLQLTRNPNHVFRHCSNTLFNILRGGIFDDQYQFDKADFLLFVKTANTRLAEQYGNLLENLPAQFDFSQFPQTSDPDFERLRLEYLPLSFSRRHGDPSRPWNMFSIDLKDEHGNKIRNYQGNWRDIFQNWEALAFSFPEFIESMITKFVNASTADGYNPYRLLRNGFDWEVLDPDDAWAYIGYWGDHQIIYLLKLLEISSQYHPQRLDTLLDKNIFTYANVPYRIRPYAEMVKDPFNTVDFDYNLEKKIEKKVATLGSDGKFIFGKNNKVYYVNLLEKLLVPLLVKLSNFVPEAGIWMNTQRPEWNDANNALVGNGASMVTLYYMRRYVKFLFDFFAKTGDRNFTLSDEVYAFYSGLERILGSNIALLQSKMSNKNRKKITDELSESGSNHRQQIYRHGFSGKVKNISAKTLLAFLEITEKYIDHSIRANRRDDGLFHAYNLISFDKSGIRIRNLYEMLEGQVSILSSGFLTVEECINLLKALRNSQLYRKDQKSYILYPNRQLPRFNEKNIIPDDIAENSDLVQKLLRENITKILKRSSDGKIHFHSRFRNAGILRSSAEGLLSKKETAELVTIYEKVFDHQSFTGRSGTFYKYEGLGSIYWHMVSKLLLAVNEVFHHALDQKCDDKTIKTLRSVYYDIKAGIGIEKNPQHYGAFPTDPYSHTPGNMGVQQPGMTGQVKEDFLSRFGELGVLIKNGVIEFNTLLLDPSEFLESKGIFVYINNAGVKKTLPIKNNALVFTIAGIPVVYKLSEKEEIQVHFSDNKQPEIFDTLQMDNETSQQVFRRSHRINYIEVFVKK
ncbi:MAG: hypothetical protein JXQ65_04600 [Candidatus Marinimicrobia bacterium]|nr:hypothetical protein [Candidatus Neomarinimicrobiota bacterium]